MIEDGSLEMELLDKTKIERTCIYQGRSGVLSLRHLGMKSTWLVVYICYLEP